MLLLAHSVSAMRRRWRSPLLRGLLLLCQAAGLPVCSPFLPARPLASRSPTRPPVSSLCARRVTLPTTGLTDIAMVYPLAVLATRREAGITMAAALKQGRFWAGGWTAGSLLIPYSICVEGGSNAIRRAVCSATGIEERSWQGDVAAAVGTASIVTYLGLQPIEKKLVMDQLLEDQGRAATGARRNPLLAPVKEIYQYAHTHGIRALYGGAVPLLLRELCYITAITIANPLVTSSIEKRARGAGGTAFGLGGSFSVGCTAGLFRMLCACLRARGCMCVHVCAHVDACKRPRLNGAMKFMYILGGAR